jgi:hypothetical protein
MREVTIVFIVCIMCRSFKAVRLSSVLGWTPCAGLEMNVPFV